MRSPEQTSRIVLVPFDPTEAIDLSKAAERAGKSQSTLRNWCTQHGLGRRVGGGVWVVSKAALSMFLDGDHEALAAYHRGDRSSALVQTYFDRYRK